MQRRIGPQPLLFVSWPREEHGAHPPLRLARRQIFNSSPEIPTFGFWTSSVLTAHSFLKVRLPSNKISPAKGKFGDEVIVPTEAGALEGMKEVSQAQSMDGAINCIRQTQANIDDALLAQNIPRARAYQHPGPNDLPVIRHIETLNAASKMADMSSRPEGETTSCGGNRNNINVGGDSPSESGESAQTLSANGMAHRGNIGERRNVMKTRRNNGRVKKCGIKLHPPPLLIMSFR